MKYGGSLILKVFFKKIITIFSSFLSLFWNNIWSLVFCIEIKQGNAACNEIELNIVAKLQNVSCEEQSKERWKKVK